MRISRDSAYAANLVHGIGGDKRAFEIAMQQLSPALTGENPFSRTRALSFSLKIGLADAPVGFCRAPADGPTAPNCIANSHCLRAKAGLNRLSRVLPASPVS